MLTGKAIEKEEVDLGIRYRFLKRQRNLRNDLFRFTKKSLPLFLQWPRHSRRRHTLTSPETRKRFGAYFP